MEGPFCYTCNVVLSIVIYVKLLTKALASTYWSLIISLSLFSIHVKRTFSMRAILFFPISLLEKPIETHRLGLLASPSELTDRTLGIVVWLVG